MVHDAKAGSRRDPTAAAESRAIHLGARPARDEGAPRPAWRSRTITPPAGRRRIGQAGEGGDQGGPAARKRRAAKFPGRKPAVKTAGNEEWSVRPGRCCDTGTGAPDPGCLRSWPEACGHRAGIPALAAGRPACYHRRATRPAQDGAIDGRGTQADGHALEFERTRFRREDRRCHPFLAADRRIEAWSGIAAVSPAASSALRQNRQKHGARVGKQGSPTQVGSTLA